MSLSNKFPFAEVHKLSIEKKYDFFNIRINYNYDSTDEVIKKYYQYINWNIYFTYNMGNTLAYYIFKKFHYYSKKCSLCQTIQNKHLFTDENQWFDTSFCYYNVTSLNTVIFKVKDIEKVIAKVRFSEIDLIYTANTNPNQINNTMYLNLINNHFLNKNELFHFLSKKFDSFEIRVKEQFLNNMPLTKAFISNHLEDVTKIPNLIFNNKNISKDVVDYFEKVILLK